MDFPNYTLVNASPVNNGSATIYQTTVQNSNGQQTDIFASGMQYPSKYQSIPSYFFIFIYQLSLLQPLIAQRVYRFNKRLRTQRYLLNILYMLQQQSILIYLRQHSFQVH